MGVSITGYTMIGIKVDWNEFFRETEVPGCEHPNDKDAKFCPLCGEKTTKIERKPIPGFNEDCEYDNDLDAYGGLYFVRRFESTECYLGIKLGSVCEDGVHELAEPCAEVLAAFTKVANGILQTKFNERPINLLTIVRVSC